MPPIPPEVQMLLETYKNQLAATMQQVETLRGSLAKMQDEMRPSIRQEMDIYRQQFEIRVHAMEKDIEELKQIIKDLKEKDLAELQKALTKNQNDSSSRIIKMQTAILLAILTGLIGLFFTYFHP